MTPELAYFLKINIAIALFYAFYRLFFYRDTFFQWRRTVLLCFLVISPLYPVLNIQEWIRSHEPMVAMVDLYATIVLPEIEITPEVRAADWQSIILSTVNIIYWSGVTLLLVRFFAQLASILRLRLRCRKDQIEGIPVYLLDKESGPFSFFHWIFIYPQAHPQNELSEILTHEGTHARQRHSIDVIISELMCIACWFNPFMWLMKREVRNNLEYMADNRVLEAGHDSVLSISFVGTGTSKERDHPFQQLQCVAAEEPYHDDEQKENQGDRTNQVSVIYPLGSCFDDSK